MTPEPARDDGWRQPTSRWWFHWEDSRVCHVTLAPEGYFAWTSEDVRRGPFKSLEAAKAAALAHPLNA